MRVVGDEVIGERWPSTRSQIPQSHLALLLVCSVLKLEQLREEPVKWRPLFQEASKWNRWLCSRYVLGYYYQYS